MKRRAFNIWWWDEKGNKELKEVRGYELDLGTLGVRWFVYCSDERDQRKKPWCVSEYNTGLKLCASPTLREAKGLAFEALEQAKHKPIIEVVRDCLREKGRANPDENELFGSLLTEYEIAR